MYRDILHSFPSLIRDGGMLYVQVPNLWLGETLFMQSHAAIHCHTFSLHSLAELMKQNGFIPVRVQADNNLHILASKTSRVAHSQGGRTVPVMSSYWNVSLGLMSAMVVIIVSRLIMRRYK